MTPTHIAIIMDGNRRWAREKGLPIFLGHTKGYQRIKQIVLHAKARGIKHLTFWAFSTENWNRDPKEVDDLMKIFRRLFKESYFKKLMQENTKVVVFGDMTKFPDDIQKNVAKGIAETKDNTAITVNIALNYGGRAEIVQAVKALLAKKPKVIDEQTIADFLYSKGQPDPDLVIRTGGEQRLSGYLPWQSVYSELYFTKTYWPDFDNKAFDQALEEFSGRQRRFGK